MVDFRKVRERMRDGEGAGGRPAAVPALDRSALELRGAIARIRFQRDGFVIAELRGGESIKGNLREPALGLEYHFVGKWVSDPKWGWTFVFDDARPILPTTTTGIRDYLKVHAPWVGPAVARELLAAFGETTLEVLKSDPDQVAAKIGGITRERAREIQAALLAREAIEKVEVDVRGLVAPAGVNMRQIRAILDKYGSEAAIVVRENPYRLIDDIDGVGWATADRIGTAVGIDRRSPARLRAGILHALREAEDEGHTCQPAPALVEAAAKILSVEERVILDRVDELTAEDQLKSYVPPGPGGVTMFPLVYRPDLYEAEAAIASTVLTLLSPAPVPAAIAPAPLETDVDPLDWLPGPDEDPPPGGQGG